MADISKIKVGNAEYTVKDQTARTHISNTSNPHSVTKSQVGLGNVEDKSSATIRGELTSGNVTSALGFTPANAAIVGANNGIASLDSSGKVPSSQLPSFVDDVIEGYYRGGSFYPESDSDADPYTPETGKIYVDKDTNKTYRYGGTEYVEISSSLALGETSSTAYRGDRGATAYGHATESKSGAQSSGLYKISVTAQGHVGGVTAVQKSDITGLGIPGSNTTYANGTGITIGSGNAINHSNSIQDNKVVGVSDVDAGGHIHAYCGKFDAQGHLKSIESYKEIEVDSSTSVTPSKASTLTGVSSAGSVPSWSASVNNETLEFSFSAGSMPTFSTGDRLTGVTVSVSSEFQEVGA